MQADGVIQQRRASVLFTNPLYQLSLQQQSRPRLSSTAVEAAAAAIAAATATADSVTQQTTSADQQQQAASTDADGAVGFTTSSSRDSFFLPLNAHSPIKLPPLYAATGPAAAAVLSQFGKDSIQAGSNTAGSALASGTAGDNAVASSSKAAKQQDARNKLPTRPRPWAAGTIASIVGVLQHKSKQGGAGRQPDKQQQQQGGLKELQQQQQQGPQQAINNMQMHLLQPSTTVAMSVFGTTNLQPKLQLPKPPSPQPPPKKHTLEPMKQLEQQQQRKSPVSLSWSGGAQRVSAVERLQAQGAHGSSGAFSRSLTGLPNQQQQQQFSRSLTGLPDQKQQQRHYNTQQAVPALLRRLPVPQTAWQAGAETAAAAAAAAAGPAVAQRFEGTSRSGVAKAPWPTHALLQPDDAAAAAALTGAAATTASSSIRAARTTPKAVAQQLQAPSAASPGGVDTSLNAMYSGGVAAAAAALSEGGGVATLRSQHLRERPLVPWASESGLQRSAGNANAAACSGEAGNPYVVQQKAWLRQQRHSQVQQPAGRQLPQQQQQQEPAGT
jgi:hypothetical protein